MTKRAARGPARSSTPRRAPLGWRWYELLLLERLREDLAQRRRDDATAATGYLARLLGTTRRRVATALRARPAGHTPWLAPPPSTGEALEEEAVLRRRVAEAIEGHLWARHGTARLRFEDWREEVRRLIAHEGSRGRGPISREEQHLAFQRGDSPWSFFEARVASCPGSIDDIPSL